MLKTKVMATFGDPVGQDSNNGNNFWEYNCPQFVDFTEPLDQDGGVEDYFNFDHESCIPLGDEEDDSIDTSLYEDAVPSTPQNSSAPQRATRSRSRSAVRGASKCKTPKTTPSSAKRARRTPREAAQNTSYNLNTSSTDVKLEESNENPTQAEESGRKNNSSHSRKRSEQSTSVTRLTGSGKKNKLVKHSSTGSLQHLTRSNSFRKGGPMGQTGKEKKPVTGDSDKRPLSRSNSLRKVPSVESSKTDLRKSSSSSADSKGAGPRRSNSMRKRTDTDVNHKDKMPAPPPMRPKLTMPVTPACMKRRGLTTSTDQRTTEQKEMECIQAMRQELSRKRKLAEDSHRKALKSTGYIPIRSSVQPTCPENIHFATDDRIKNHNMETRQDLTKDFVAGLRSNKSPVRSAPMRITQPQPFHLSKSRKETGPSANNSGYHSMAEQVIAFSSKTPTRFRSKPHNGAPSPATRARKPSVESRLTIPKTPNLETRGRKRTVHVMSQVEIEEQELDEIKRYKFTANPVNDKIMNNPNTGVKKVQPKEPTEFEEFYLETQRRKIGSQQKKDEETYKFHAKPVPKAILEGVVGVKHVEGALPTIPHSPAFALKNRLRQTFKEPEPVIVEKRVNRAQVPHHGIPFQPRVEHRVVEVQPFSFDERNRKMMVRKEKKIQQVFLEEKKAREFRANPLPDLCPDLLPQKKGKGITQLEPFNLECDVRGAMKAEEWSQKVLGKRLNGRPQNLAQLRIEQELEEQRMASNAFKARSSKVLYQEPFFPKKSTKPLTDVNDVQLFTERRAGKRSVWEDHIKEKDDQIKAHTEEMERRRMEEENAEVEQIRAEAVHKSQPIRKYRPVVVKPSEKALTLPHTPRFSDRLRTRSVRM